MNYFSRMQIFVEYKCISYSFGFHCNSQIWHKSSKRKIRQVFLVKKCNPLHKFSFDIKVTFSRHSVDKTGGNSSGRAKVKDNEYTKVTISIRESV